MFTLWRTSWIWYSLRKVLQILLSYIIPKMKLIFFKYNNHVSFIVYFRYVSIKLAYKQHQIKHLCSDAVTKIIQCYILTSLCLLLITNDFASFHSIIYEKYVELSLEFFISEYVRSMLLQHGVLFLSFWWKEKKSRKSSSIIYVRQDDVDKLAKLRQIFGHSKITSS